MDKELNRAIRLFNEFKLEEAKQLLEQIVLQNADNIMALLTLGKIHSRNQKYGEAMNCFNKVLTIDEGNDDAHTGLQLIRNILQLSNNYYYENPYTDDDLYDF